MHGPFSKILGGPPRIDAPGPSVLNYRG